MTRVCTICTHPARQEIDRLLVAGKTSYRAITRQYSDVSRHALSRHRQNCLPAQLAQAYAAEEVAQADTLLDELRRCRKGLDDLLGLARKIAADSYKADKDARALDAIRTAGSVHREIRRHLELLAEVEGELDRRQAVTVNVLAMPEYLTIIRVLRESYPAAALAVSDALAELESGNGHS